MSDNAIRRIQVGDLRKMNTREGLILQGCGGDPQEWLGRDQRNAHGCRNPAQWQPV